MPINIDEFELVVEPPEAQAQNSGPHDEVPSPPQPMRMREFETLQWRHERRMSRLRAD